MRSACGLESVYEDVSWADDSLEGPRLSSFSEDRDQYFRTEAEQGAGMVAAVSSLHQGAATTPTAALPGPFRMTTS